MDLAGDSINLEQAKTPDANGTSPNCIFLCPKERTLFKDVIAEILIL